MTSTLLSKDGLYDLEMSIADETEEKIGNNEESDDMQCDIEEVSRNMSRTLAVNGAGSAKKADAKEHTSSEAVKPCGRINSCMVVGRDTLYMFGGMMEIRVREITLDDLYSLNLSKLDEWKCIIPASESEWLDVSEDEDGDNTEDDASSNESNRDETDDDDEDDDDIIKPDDNGEKALDVGNAVSILRGEKRNLRRKEKRARIEQIRVILGLSDSQRTLVGYW